MATLDQYSPTMVGLPQQVANTGYQYTGQAPLNQLGLPQPQIQESAGDLNLGQFGPANVVNQLVDSFTNNNSPYIQNARQRGLEVAANRGLINGSIAAGNSQRAAMEAAQPLVSEAVGLLNAREQRALSRDNVQQQAVLQDWLDTNKFNREFNGSLSLLPIKNTFDMFQTLMQYGAENPQVWTPDVISGTSNFFQRNMFDILNQYFPGTFNRGGTP